MAPFRTLALVPLACVLLLLPLAPALPASGDAVAHADAADDLDWGMGGAMRNLLGKRKPRCDGKGQKCCEDESKAPCTAPLTSCSEKTKRCLPCGLLNGPPCDSGEPCYPKLEVNEAGDKCVVAPPAKCVLEKCPMPDDHQCMEPVCIYHEKAGSHCGFKAKHGLCLVGKDPTAPGVCSEGTCEPCGAEGDMCCPAGAPVDQWDVEFGFSGFSPYLSQNCDIGQECLGKALKKTCKPCTPGSEQQCDELLIAGR